MKKFLEAYKQDKARFAASLAVVVLVFVISLWPLKRLYDRYTYDRHNRDVEVTVSLEAANQLCKRENYNIANLLDRLKTIGVSSVIIDEESIDSLAEKEKIIYFSRPELSKFKILGFISPATIISADTILVKNPKLANYLKSTLQGKTSQALKETQSGPYRILSITGNMRSLGWGYLEENIELAKKNNLNVLLSPYSKFWVPKTLPENISGILITENFGESDTAAITDSGIKAVLKEFSKEEQRFSRALVPAGSSIARLYCVFPEKIVVTDNYITEAVNKSLKAVRERNCRVLCFDFRETMTLEQNMDVLRGLCNKIKADNFNLSSGHFPLQVEDNYPAGISKVIGLLLAIIFPVISMYAVKKVQPYWLSGKIQPVILVFFVVCLINIAGGLLISSMFVQNKFLIKLDEFRGVKLSMLLPIVLSVFIFFNLKQLKGFLERPVKFGSLFLCFSLLIAAVIILVRSGNTTFVPSLELKFRALLENSLLIRPRFKEFLIGHPALIVGLFFNSWIFIIIGLIGQVSIVNTFTHFHTPLVVSLVRVVYGIILGVGIGFSVAAVLKSEFYAKIKDRLGI